VADHFREIAVGCLNITNTQPHGHRENSDRAGQSDAVTPGLAASGLITRGKTKSATSRDGKARGLSKAERYRLGFEKGLFFTRNQRNFRQPAGFCRFGNCREPAVAGGDIILIS
jgi:hypothetical protein